MITAENPHLTTKH